jgi:hypothetical protein
MGFYCRYSGEMRAKRFAGLLGERGWDGGIRVEIQSMESKKSTCMAQSDPNAASVPSDSSVVEAETCAATVLRPGVQGAFTIKDYTKEFGEVDPAALANQLVGQMEEVNKGDLKHAEAILAVQAQTLDAIFNGLARRAAVNAGKSMAACETYLRLALKAQSQCRATLETLAMIKNPRPLAFVKQANIAAGPQQINNVMPVAGISRARKSKSQKSPNKLLEAHHDKWLDGRTASSPSNADSQLAAVGEIDRTENLAR